MTGHGLAGALSRHGWERGWGERPAVMAARGQRHRRRSLAPLAAFAAAAGLAVAGCATTAAPAPRSVGHPHLHVASAPIGSTATVGEEARSVIWVTNDGDWPVLLIGVTPQAPSDEAVSLVERVRGRPRYDGSQQHVVLEPPLGRSDQALIHRGLLLPGEAVELYTSLVPLECGTSVHAFRLDYLTAPWETLKAHVYLAGSGGPDAIRRFRRYDEPPRGLERPRIRRTILADGNAVLTRAATRFQTVLPQVEERDAMPLKEAYRIARIQPGGRIRYSEHLDGWAFARPGGVTAACLGGRRMVLDGVTLEALRAIDQHEDPVPLLFGDAEAYEALAHLVVTPYGVGPQMALVPRSAIDELLETLAGAGLTLATVSRELTVTAKDPGARPLLAHR